MQNEGTVDVWGIVFSWSVIDGDEPVITVSHPDYASKSERLRFSPAMAARVIAKELILAKDGPRNKT